MKLSIYLRLISLYSTLFCVLSFSLSLSLSFAKAHVCSGVVYGFFFLLSSKIFGGERVIPAAFAAPLSSSPWLYCLLIGIVERASTTLRHNFAVFHLELPFDAATDDAAGFL